MKKEIYELINENKKLIYKIASKYSNYSALDDLFQVGCIGLINAYKNFNNKFDTKFSTYAYTYILGEITNYIKNDRLIKIGAESSKIYKIYEKTKEYLTALNGRIPNIHEIAEFMGINSYELYKSITNHYVTESIDAEIKDDLLVQEVIGNDDREAIDMKIDLLNVVNSLPQADKNLINYRYYQDYTQGETAEIMGMSQVQVSRRENKILSRMKKEMVS